MRQLKRLLRYVKGSEDMSTVFEVRDNNEVKKLGVNTHSAWASEQNLRKSTTGAVIMTESMRLHAHSGGQASVALSSCEAQSDGSVGKHQGGTVVARGVDVCWYEDYEIDVRVDSSAAHAFFHRRSVGRMKHICSKILWLRLREV